MLRFLYISLICFSFQYSGNCQEFITVRKAVKLMGCGFELAVTAKSDTIAWQALESGIREIERIENLISSWKPTSQTSEINRQAGISTVKVDKELYDLIYRSKKVSNLTGGAFDISFASMNHIWNFDQKDHKLPSPEYVNVAKANINYQNILLNQQDTSVYLASGMRIGFGAIGKGYAANKAKQIISNTVGVYGGVINASGDLLCWGKSSNDDGWKINISNPQNKEKPLAWITVKNQAVVTSGDYEKYFTSKGKRYAHIIDPRTGYPASGVLSVTLICQDAELADALATSVFVLGNEKGIELINKINNVACIIITTDGKIHASEELQLNYF